jgi:hypothetical protein
MSVGTLVNLRYVRIFSALDRVRLKPNYEVS